MHSLSINHVSFLASIEEASRSQYLLHVRFEDWLLDQHVDSVFERFLPNLGADFFGEVHNRGQGKMRCLTLDKFSQHPGESQACLEIDHDQLVVRVAAPYFSTDQV